jgi:hypothetical protein
MQAPSTE